ncbi:MAG: hypothetical protein ED557_05760 [Balneola sp.]|nr:MAG: hypothetical protein ED557_05760 [Balneola sp.]
MKFLSSINSRFLLGDIFIRVLIILLMLAHLVIILLIAFKPSLVLDFFEVVFVRSRFIFYTFLFITIANLSSGLFYKTKPFCLFSFLIFFSLSVLIINYSRSMGLDSILMDPLYFDFEMLSFSVIEIGVISLVSLIVFFDLMEGKELENSN